MDDKLLLAPGPAPVEPAVGEVLRDVGADVSTEAGVEAVRAHLT